MSTDPLVAAHTWQRVKENEIIRSAVAGASLDYPEAETLCEHFFVSLLCGKDALGMVPSALLRAPRMFALGAVVGDDAANATIAAAYLTARFAPQLADTPPEDIEQKLAELMAAPDAEDGDGDDDPDGGAIAASAADNELDELTKQIEAAIAGLDAAVAQLVPEDDPLSPTPVSLRDRLALANELSRSPQLRRIIAECGRLRRLQYGKASHGLDPNDMSGVQLGNTIPRLVASEYGGLVLDELRPDFFARYASEQLLMRRPGQQAPMGQGPILVHMDSSGSMGLDMNYGIHPWPWESGVERQDIAKAIALAVLHQARDERRDIAIVHFGERHHYRIWHFPKGEAEIPDLIACLSYFADANYEHYGDWMTKALDLVEDSRYDKADVLVIADAEPGAARTAGMPAEHWNELRAKRGMRCFGIMLGNTAENILEGMCDEVTRVAHPNDLEGLSGALNV